MCSNRNAISVDRNRGCGCNGDENVGGVFDRSCGCNNGNVGGNYDCGCDRGNVGGSYDCGCDRGNVGGDFDRRRHGCGCNLLGCAANGVVSTICRVLSGIDNTFSNDCGCPR